MEEEEEEEVVVEASLDGLPSALVATIMTKLDIASICSLASTSSALRSCARHILSFLPSFHLLDVAPSAHFLRPLLPPNPYLTALKLDCARLDDSAIAFLLKPSLHHLSLHNCADFSGRLLSEIGTRCSDLRSLYLGSVAENRGRAIHISDLEELLSGCSHLEALILMFDVSLFLRHNFARVWASASEKLTSLEIGYISSVTVTELLSPNLGAHLPSNPVQPSILPSIQKLCLNVDYITDAMIGTISKGLVLLIHLDLQDAPLIEPRITFDLTNAGLQQINQLGRLKHLSLVRSQEFLITYFRRVNDLGLLLMADKCANLESICLGGFCRVTDTGFKTILHSCSRLYKLKAIGTLPRLKILLLDGSDITDAGLLYLRSSVISSLYALSLRGCKRLTDKCITALFNGCCVLELRELDLSNLPNLSDNGVLLLAKSRIPFFELRMRQCPLIGDTAVMALASMLVDDARHGSSLRLLDLYNCGGITPLAFRWLKKPYFPRLKWLGVTGNVNRDMVDALARSRPFLHVACHGEELGADPYDTSDGLYTHDYDDVDEFEQWLLEADIDSDYEEVGDAENNDEMVV
uniref:F-box/LRR-repeat protein 10 n=1 Tax=Cajanus cajan TaxID=3821 RepID=A0A151TQ77_CAJCA|nr:F-box/LRR-repeat protein 10 [Cajanus cajan]